MRGKTNSNWFEISNRRENKFCLHEVSFQLHFKTILHFDGMPRHFISSSAYVIFYHPKWNFISVKMTLMKSIPTMSFKRKCKLNRNIQWVISLRVNSAHMKISCQFETSFRSKWPMWNPYCPEFHFVSIHMNTSIELTKHQSEIFNCFEISYQFKFISPRMWMYS